MFPFVNQLFELNFPEINNALVLVGLFFFLWGIAWLPLAILIVWRLKWKPFEPLTLQQKLPLLAVLYFISPGIIWLFLQWQELSWKDCGVEATINCWVFLFVGLIIGLGSILLTFMLEGWLGWLQWQTDNWKKLWPTSLNLLAGALIIGLAEEIIFRGFLQTLLEIDYSPAFAAVLASIIFALLHLIWGDDATKPQLPGLWVMGMVLVFARWVAGGNIGLAWGLHSAWLWGLWSLDAANLFTYSDRSNAWLVGWKGQPLAGVAGLFCLGGTTAILWLTSSFIVH